MTRVLVLGGYGGFGGRISRRLSAVGHIVLVAGRSLARAQTFCRGQDGLVPVELNRRNIAEALEQYAPDLVVDASGPFQAMDLTIPKACVEAGVHYCDIADSTSFVLAVASLNAAAIARAVVIISGASSVPALSGAAARILATGMDRVSSVEIAISASNRAAAGPAVAAAIFGQLGQPFSLWRGGRQTTVYGWQEPIRLNFAVPGLPPLARRNVGLVDVPDVALLPDRLPGRPSVTFRAGTDVMERVECAFATGRLFTSTILQCHLWTTYSAVNCGGIGPKLVTSHIIIRNLCFLVFSSAVQVAFYLPY